MAHLTKQQIERQDFVDNQIFELMQKLISPSKRINWNIEMIGSIRDAIFSEVSGKVGRLGELEFYP